MDYKEVISVTKRQKTVYGYKKIIFDTNLTNTRAQHVYEKLGFKKIGIKNNSWKNQLGELQSSVDYKLMVECATEKG